jgi:hypothetical protein
MADCQEPDPIRKVELRVYRVLCHASKVRRLDETIPLDVNAGDTIKVLVGDVQFEVDLIGSKASQPHKRPKNARTRRT